MTLYIGLDDTDTRDSERGTGRLARDLAAHLEPTLAAMGARFVGITRHQLLNDPRVPMTAKNSCAAIHIALSDATAPDLAALQERAAAYMVAQCPVGSDPGLCLAILVPDAITAFGQRAQQELVNQAEARTLAAEHDIRLMGLGGTQDGVIGALSAVGLAASGDDGRYTHVGRNREMAGVATIAEVLAAGIAAVCTLDGEPVRDGVVITGGKLRPSMRRGVAILYVERHADGWHPLKLD